MLSIIITKQKKILYKKKFKINYDTNDIYLLLYRIES